MENVTTSPKIPDNDIEAKTIVTFVMPAYNAGKYIAQAIESIEGQTISEGWSLLVCDDGSTDDTLEIVKKYADKDSRVKWMRMPQNSGCVYQPRKAAIVAAKSQYVAPLDADDWIEPDYLEKLMSELRNDSVDAVYPTMHTGSDGRIFLQYDASVRHKDFKGKDCVKFTLDGWRIHCNGGIIKREIYLRTFGKYDSSLTYPFSDELLTRQLLSECSIVRFSDAKYFYRENDESITHHVSYKLFGYLINHCSLIDFTREIYGTNSEEYLLAQRQNFHGIFDALKLLNRYSFSKSDTEYAMKHIKDCAGKIDNQTINGNVSRKYRLLLKLGFKPARFILSILKR